MDNFDTNLNVEDYLKRKSLLNQHNEESKRMEEFKLKDFDIISIGTIDTIFNKKNGTPRQSGICPQSKGIIRLHKTLFNNPSHTFEGIEQFEFVWILYHFHENKSKRRLNAKVYPPRLDGKSCGVFASRAPYRPNPIGLTLAKIDYVKDGLLYVSGIDIIDGSPIIDIKPYIEKYDRPKQDEENVAATVQNSSENIESNKTDQMTASTSVAEGWVDGSIVSTVDVEFTPRSLSQLLQFHSPLFHTNGSSTCDHCLRLFNDHNQAREAIINLLHADPRSVYRRNKCVDRLYYFTIDTIHITAWFDIETHLVEVIKIKPFKDQAKQHINIKS